MKRIFIICLYFLFIAGFSSCNKNDLSFNYKTERPITALFEDESVITGSWALNDEEVTNITFNEDNFYEFVFEFHVNKPGDVIQVAGIVPGPGSLLGMGLGDITDPNNVKNLHTEVYLYPPGAPTFSFYDLSEPIPLNVGKKYAIYIITDDYYKRSRMLLDDYPYPITYGNVTITNFLWKKFSESGYPTKHANYIAGYPDFTYRTFD